jgi:hypothetical protein
MSPAELNAVARLVMAAKGPLHNPTSEGVISESATPSANARVADSASEAVVSEGSRNGYRDTCCAPG